MRIRTNRRFQKMDAHRSDNAGGSSDGGYRDATDIEQASHAVNAINARIRREATDKNSDDYARHRAKVTLPSQYDAWLKKEIP